MLRMLLPKKNEFFERFSRHAALSVEGARLLEALFADLRHVEERARRIREVEHDADGVRPQNKEKTPPPSSPPERGPTPNTPPPPNNTGHHQTHPPPQVSRYNEHPQPPPKTAGTDHPP